MRKKYNVEEAFAETLERLGLCIVEHQWIAGTHPHTRLIALLNRDGYGNG